MVRPVNSLKVFHQIRSSDSGFIHVASPVSSNRAELEARRMIFSNYVGFIRRFLLFWFVSTYLFELQVKSFSSNRAK